MLNWIKTLFTKKYELTDETMDWHGITLYRIRALKDFSIVHAGDLGGWVESEENLSQRRNCWIFGEEKSLRSCKIYGGVRILDQAIVCNYAKVGGFMTITGSTNICGNICMKGHYGRVECINMKYGETRLVDMRGNRICWSADM